MYTIEETPNQAYIKIKEYFSRPGAVLAKDGAVHCLYRTETGAACAVGCLLPDHVAREADIRGSTIEGMYREGTIGAVHHETIDFLDEAQISHDRAKSVEEFLTSLERIAL